MIACHSRGSHIKSNVFVFAHGITLARAFCTYLGIFKDISHVAPITILSRKNTQPYLEISKYRIIIDNLEQQTSPNRNTLAVNPILLLLTPPHILLSRRDGNQMAHGSVGAEAPRAQT
jgi:hypothetical protein